MTLKELYNNTLIEIDKVKAPYLYIEDFNFYANRAVNNYVNKRYNLYELTQQLTDDLQVLKGIYYIRPDATLSTATVEIEGIPDNPIAVEKVIEGGKLRGIRFQLPSNYYHFLKCTINYSVINRFKCYPVGEITSFDTKRRVDNQNIANNYFYKADYRQCYHYIYNNVATIQPKIELSTGVIAPNLAYDSIDIRYLKTPQKLILLQSQIDGTDDTSQILEFPEYVCEEILKDLVALILERGSDPRLQSHIPVNKSIPDNYNQQ